MTQGLRRGLHCCAPSGLHYVWLLHAQGSRRGLYSARPLQGLFQTPSKRRDKYPSFGSGQRNTFPILGDGIPIIKAAIPHAEDRFPVVKVLIPDPLASVLAVKVSFPSVKTGSPQVKVAIPGAKVGIPKVKVAIPTVKTAIPSVKTGIRANLVQSGALTPCASFESE